MRVYSFTIGLEKQAMPQTAFSPEWLNQFSDPYAVLGLSLASDDRRVLKRYHTIAKLLHPDSLSSAQTTAKEFANHLLTCLVNPAYQELKQVKTRTERVALLRLRAKHLEPTLSARGKIAQQLLQISAQELDVFYEQAIIQLAELQFQPLSQFETTTQQLTELNLLYLHLTANDSSLREKPTGIIAAQPIKPTQFAPSTVEATEVAVSYAQRHYQRAQDYAQKAAWSKAVMELRDAIRLESDRSDYHALLAKAYLMQNLTGMARVHFRQALKLNPNDALALQYANKLNVSSVPPKPPAQTVNSSSTVMKGSATKSIRGNGIFSLFTRKR